MSKEIKYALAILEDLGDGYKLSNFNHIDTGRRACLLLENGEIAKTSEIVGWSSYPDKEIETNNSIYYIRRIYN